VGGSNYVVPQQVSTVSDSSDPQKPVIPQAWQDVLELQKNGRNWNGSIKAVNKGGVVVDVNGLRGFIPWSRLDPARLPGPDMAPQEAQKLVGEPISAKVIQVILAALT
jgi:small subunit ribosomal protein S1